MKPAYIAVDFGAGSGRVIAGVPGPDGSLPLDEVYRFDNRRVRLGRHIYWDFPALFADMLEGLRRCVAKGYRLTFIGVDTWGVDFGLLGISFHTVTLHVSAPLNAILPTRIWPPTTPPPASR